MGIKNCISGIKLVDISIYAVFFKKGPNPASFLVYSLSFPQHKDKYSTNFTINDKSIDGVLGSRTRGSMMEVADESTELWRHP